MRLSGSVGEQEATFYICIHFRQHASWQGSIRWLEGKKSVFFRSMLEMTMLMLEAARSTSGNPGMPALMGGSGDGRQAVIGEGLFFESEEIR